MMVRCIASALVCALTAGAALAQDVVPEEGRRRVEWPVTASTLSATAARVFPAGSAVKFAAAPIPVLAPAGLQAVDRAAFAQSFGSTPDGYFAVLPRGDYDVVFNGTISYAIAPQLVKKIPRDGFTYLYEEGEAGTNISFSRFGADYLLQFECRDAPGGANDCITESEAVELADSLVIVGGGGR